MTKEQAIEEINKAFEPAFANYIITALTEGATVSDKVLEQQPSDDCISRKRIKQIVSNITAEYDTETIHIDRLMDEIDDMPPVTPTRKVGKWTRLSNTIPCVNCQLCGKTFSFLQGGNTLNYCPFCGCYMRKEEK